MSTAPTEATSALPALAARWEHLRSARQGLRIRDAALQLGVSELELAALAVGGGTVRLAGSFRDMLRAVPTLGRVMALTRNEHCVHERKGVYQNVSFTGHVGLALGPDIDLRIFVGGWAHALAVSEPGKEAPRRSLQFFDAAGTALHKIYLLPESDLAAFDGFVARFRAADQSPGAHVEAWSPKPEPDVGTLDVGAFQADWDALQDTHDFVPLLRRHKVARLRALRLAGIARAVRVTEEAGRAVLERAAASALPIMVFVGNHGMIQIHTGPVKRTLATGPWFNVLDPDFNLHLRESAIAEAWLVRKPTRDGVVTSVELFEAAGGLIATYFGKRKPGQLEDPDWRALAEGLARRES